MFKLPQKTILGNLSIKNTLEFFDFPRLFTCVNNSNNLYLALSTFDDEYECNFLYLPISPLRLQAILMGKIALNKAFTEPEDGYLYVVKTFNDRLPEVTHVFPEQISESDLPAPGYYLQEIEEEIEDNVINPHEVARASRREAFNYHIYPHIQKHEIAARKLGAILTVTQELIDALGQATDGDPTVRGPLPVELLNKNKVHVTKVFQGSFGVQFRAAQFSDLLEDSKVSDALQEFGNLILAGDSADLLSNKLHFLKGRVASKYRRLLKELSDIGSGLIVDWGAVNNQRGGTFSLSQTQIENAYEIVDRIDIDMAEEITIRGKLIGFNSRTQKYEILSTEDSKNYAGKVASDAQILINHPAIGDYYVARLRMLVETQSTSGDELIRWVLVGLSQHTSG